MLPQKSAIVLPARLKLRPWIRRGCYLLLALMLLGAFAWSQRVLVLQHSLGWITDWRNPRAPNRPVPWEPGPDQAEAPPTKRPPNIILIVADDLGINDVGMHRVAPQRGWVDTPAIDSIARDGLRFERGYAGAAVCTVSRAAIMTGRSPWRCGVEFTPTPVALGRIADPLYYQPTRVHPALVARQPTRDAPPFPEPASTRTRLPASEVPQPTT